MANNDDAPPHGMKRPNKEEKRHVDPAINRKESDQQKPLTYGDRYGRSSVPSKNVKKDPKEAKTKESKTKEPDLNELRRVHSESNTKSNVPPARKKVEISTTPKKEDLDNRPSVKKPMPGTVQDGRREHGKPKNGGSSVVDRAKAAAKQKALDKAWGKKGK